MRSSVDLPQPDGPTSTTSSPSATSKLAPATATWPFAYTFAAASSRTPAMMPLPWCAPRAADRDTMPAHHSASCKRFTTGTSRWLRSCDRFIRVQRSKLAVSFPAGFLWGAATSAYQIEGSPLADGAGPSIWQRFCHTPGMVTRRRHGRRGLRSLPALRDDVALMRELGLKAYRFSIAWGRVLPEAAARSTPPGLGFYDRLVDALLEHGIEPLAHAVSLGPARGARRSRRMAQSRHRAVVRRLRERRVPETRRPRQAAGRRSTSPGWSPDGGYLHGVLAPGHRNLFEAPIATHNLLRAHGAAVQAYRSDRQAS